MIVIVAKTIAKPEAVEAFKVLAKELVHKSREENGCIEYALHQDIKNTNILTFIEKWEDEAAIKRHNESDHFQTIVPQLNSFREKEAEVNLYEELDL